MPAEYKTYFGKRFYKDKKGYFVNSMPIHAQRWVWINHHGAIPEKMDVHHKDGDKGNNEIENLELVSRSDHLKKHWREGSFDLEQRRAQLNEARRWLKTPIGRKNQSEDAKIGWEKRKRNPIKKICLGCDKEFDTFQLWAKCCGGTCYQRYRRKNGIGSIERNCWWCDNPFRVERKSIQRTCSKECETQLRDNVSAPAQ